MSIKELIPMFQTETLATLYMVGVSTLISYLIGIPLGVILIVTEDGGLYPIKPVHAVLGFLTKIFRTIPFLILLVMVLPITKFLVHTTLGPNAIIPPLVFAAAPYIARMVESSLKEVDAGGIEAARSMGANRLQIIWKVSTSLLPLLTLAVTLRQLETMPLRIGRGRLASRIRNNHEAPTLRCCLFATSPW